MVVGKRRTRLAHRRCGSATLTGIANWVARFILDATSPGDNDATAPTSPRLRALFEPTRVLAAEYDESKAFDRSAARLI